MATDTHGGTASDTADEMLSVGQAAKLIGYSVSTLQRWDRDGLLTAYRSPTNQRRYSRAELLAAVERAA
jgi:excisionase family DNA binding protein